MVLKSFTSNFLPAYDRGSQRKIVARADGASHKSVRRSLFAEAQTRPKARPNIGFYGTLRLRFAFLAGTLPDCPDAKWAND